MKKRPTVWIAAALALVFLAGAAAGIFFERLVLSPRPHHRRPPSHFPSLEMMARELGLNADQQARIKEIFERNEERFRALRGDIRKNLNDIREQLKREIDAVLTPEQISKLQDMIARHKDKARREYERSRTGGQGRPPVDQRKEGE
ncbi:MAG: periplasmic heavy metal sensor [Candidatus Aminicenantes bacterium]|nr:periplasmic heavy metal sensor [Candidatus Aminicenantes bacterium]